MQYHATYCCVRSISCTLLLIPFDSSRFLRAQRSCNFYVSYPLHYALRLTPFALRCYPSSVFCFLSTLRLTPFALRCSICCFFCGYCITTRVFFFRGMQKALPLTLDVRNTNQKLLTHKHYLSQSLNQILCL